jgi:hypothetical protein
VPTKGAIFLFVVTPPCCAASGHSSFSNAKVFGENPELSGRISPGPLRGSKLQVILNLAVSTGTPWTNLEILQNKGSELEHEKDCQEVF